MALALVAVLSFGVAAVAAARPTPFPLPYNGFVGTSGFGFGAGSMVVGPQVKQHQRLSGGLTLRFAVWSVADRLAPCNDSALLFHVLQC